jgi:tRNA-2-methylthio-N6-dimethylallyladenosine synthase
MAAGLSANPALPAAAGSYRVETWGCQMNVLDGERMAGQLERLGLSAAPEGAEADVVVLNTCSVRDKADQKVYSALGVLAERKREHPGLVIGVAGCLAQVTGDEIRERAPWVDFVLGTGSVERLGEVVERVRRERGRESLRELPEDSPVYQFRQISRGSRFQAYVTVIEGCDQFCTFCIVPFTRGRERSRRAGEIAEEAAWLVAQGYSEITLLGQTVNAYQNPEDGSGLGAPGGALPSRVCAACAS